MGLKPAESESEGLGTWMKGLGRGKRKFLDLSFPSQSLWIERKIFCAFPLIPGRTIRVLEIASDRSFSVDFKANEVSWFIGALREAGKAFFEAPFSKKVTIGGRSMVLSTGNNRAGVFIKMVCSLRGKIRRTLLIPAGDKGVGWCKLANLLANISSGGKPCAKKPFVPSSINRSVEGSLIWDPAVRLNFSFAEAAKGKEKLKEKLLGVDGWKEGFSSELLKIGLNMSVDAPSASSETFRCFAWKPIQTELGYGMVVVEKTLRSYSSGLSDGRQTRESSEGSIDGDGSAGEGDAEESRCGLVDERGAEETVSVLGDEVEGFSNLGKVSSPILTTGEDEVGASILGKGFFKFQNICPPSDALKMPCADLLAGGPALSNDAPATELLGSGPSTSGLVQCFLAVAFAMLSAEVNRDKTARRAPINISGPCKSPVSVMDDKRVESQPLDIRLGDGKMTVPSVPTVDGPGLADRGDGVSYKGLLLKPIPNGSEEVSHLVMPDRSYGGPPLGMGVQLDDKTDTHQSLESPSSLSAEALSSSREGNINSDMRFLARHEDITIIDNEEALSFDSPVLDCRFRVVEERSVEDGVRCPDECLSDSEKGQWSFNLAEKMCQFGFIRQEDRALVQAHIIKDLLQDA